MFLTATKRKLCNQTVDNYANALEYVPDSYKAQKMCYKAVDSNSFCNSICSWML